MSEGTYLLQAQIFECCAEPPYCNFRREPLSPVRRRKPETEVGDRSQLVQDEQPGVTNRMSRGLILNEPFTEAVSLLMRNVSVESMTGLVPHTVWPARNEPHHLSVAEPGECGFCIGTRKRSED
jgi:hypothetical protein